MPKSSPKSLDRTLKKVICPKCGREAKIIPCYVCNSPAGSLRLTSKDKCPYCGGKGYIIYCEWCERNKRLSAEAALKERQKSLKRNPFLPYYDDKF